MKRIRKRKLMRIQWRDMVQKPVCFFLRRMPVVWKQPLLFYIGEKFEGQFSETREETERRAERFLLEEGMMLFWGIIILAMMVAGFTIYRMAADSEPSRFFRNEFGEGDKEISLILKQEDKEKEYSFTLQEKDLSPEEEKKLRNSFFMELEKTMAGENVSLRQTEHPLCFEDRLPGWPFQIRYEPKSSRYIYLDGRLGQWDEIAGDKNRVKTQVTVTAEYEDYKWIRSFDVILTEPEEEKAPTDFERAEALLERHENRMKAQEEYVLPDTVGGIGVEEKDSFSLWGVFLLGMAILLFLLVHRISDIKNKENTCRRETLRDFPVIVHLLALYMGAGLSFASAVHRISADYLSGSHKQKKYAFEEIVRMDARMRLGEGQQDACMWWGRRFKEPVYQKLSLTLLQVMGKGTREGRELMEHMEQEAFRKRMDQARKEGEEASTRLLFPMILLLVMVMILVMFPAVMRFQGL